MGFVPLREEKGRLLKKYRSVPGRKIETSVVLADSKESTSFFPDRSVSITGIVFMVSAKRETFLEERISSPAAARGWGSRWSRRSLPAPRT
jgi:hypothetical protein